MLAMDEKIRIIVFMVFIICIGFFWAVAGLHRDVVNLQKRIDVIEKVILSSDDQAT